MRDLYNLHRIAAAFSGNAVKATAQGPNIDVTPADGVLFAVKVSALGDTLDATNNYEFRVRESFDGGTTFTDAPAQYVQYGPTKVIGASGVPAQTFKVGYLGNAPLVAFEVLVNGAAPVTGTDIHAVAILGYLRHGADPVQVP